MLASGCGPSPQAKARNSCRWTCSSLSGDAFACRCRWQHPAAADKASPVAEPWLGPVRRPPRRLCPWVRVAREAVAAEGRVVPQQWLAQTTAPGVAPADRRRLDLVIYGASRRGEALCCDVTLVSPLRTNGRPQPASSERDGAAIDVARRRKQRRYAELARPGPQRLVVLAAEVGAHWGPEAHDLVPHLARQRSLRAPQALRAAARAGWARKWWGQLGCALQRAFSSTLLGDIWRESDFQTARPPIRS